MLGFIKRATGKGIHVRQLSVPVKIIIPKVPNSHSATRHLAGRHRQTQAQHHASMAIATEGVDTRKCPSLSKIIQKESSNSVVGYSEISESVPA